MIECYILTEEFYETLKYSPKLVKRFIDSSEEQKKQIFEDINLAYIRKRGEQFFQTPIYIKENYLWFQDDFMKQMFSITVDSELRCMYLENITNPFYNFIQRIYPRSVFLKEE